MTLDEFLLARIDEKESAQGHERSIVDACPWPEYTIAGDRLYVDGGALDRRDITAEFRRWIESQPLSDAAKRARAECDSLREIVRMASPWGWTDDGTPLGGGYIEAWWDALRALALPHAEHPDYDERWRP